MAASFQERIRNTLKKGSSEPAKADGFDDVLAEFAKTLQEAEPYVGAAIEESRHPRMRSFVTWPRYRRNERSIMLTFWWSAGTMKVLDGKGPTFTEPDQLRDYLVDFLENSAFPETLRSYNARCKEPVDGFLRTGGLTDAGPKDVMVEVPASEQKKLAEASPGERLTLVVTVERVPGAAEYVTTERYHYLHSAGFGLRLHDQPKDEKGKLSLRGEAMNVDASSVK